MAANPSVATTAFLASSGLRDGKPGTGDLSGWMSALMILLTFIGLWQWDHWKWRQDKKAERQRDRWSLLNTALELECHGYELSDSNHFHRYLLEARREQDKYEAMVDAQEEEKKGNWWTNFWGKLQGRTWLDFIRRCLKCFWVTIRCRSWSAGSEEWDIIRTEEKAAELKEKTDLQRKAYLNGFDLSGHPIRDRSNSRNRKMNLERGRRWYKFPGQ